MNDQKDVGRPPTTSFDGDRNGLDRLFAIVYEELRRVAHRELSRERGDHTLGTTALVHEAYLKLAKLDRIE